MRIYVHIYVVGIIFAQYIEKADHIVQHTISLTGFRCLLERARIGPGVANGHCIVAYALHIFSQCLWPYTLAPCIVCMPLS